jgi:hypothetical protein
MKDWADDLEPFPRDVIGKALVSHRRDSTRRPVPAHIIKLCLAETRHRRLMNEAPEPEVKHQPPRITPQRAAEIMAEMGFAPRRMHDGQGG